MVVILQYLRFCLFEMYVNVKPVLYKNSLLLLLLSNDYTSYTDIKGKIHLNTNTLKQHCKHPVTVET